MVQNTLMVSINFSRWFIILPKQIWPFFGLSTELFSFVLSTKLFWICFFVVVFFFQRKEDLAFLLTYLLVRYFTWNVKPYFLWKIQNNKIFGLLQLIVISTKGTDRDVIVILVSALVCESCFVNPFMLTLLLLNTICPILANSVDPDQLASEETNWSGSALFVIKYVNFYKKPGLAGN